MRGTINSDTWSRGANMRNPENNSRFINTYAQVVPQESQMTAVNTRLVESTVLLPKPQELPAPAAAESALEPASAAIAAEAASAAAAAAASTASAPEFALAFAPTPSPYVDPPAPAAKIPTYSDVERVLVFRGNLVDDVFKKFWQMMHSTFTRDGDRSVDEIIVIYDSQKEEIRLGLELIILKKAENIAATVRIKECKQSAHDINMLRIAREKEEKQIAHNANEARIAMIKEDKRIAHEANMTRISQEKAERAATHLKYIEGGKKKKN